jgi:hypothetical protein
MTDELIAEPVARALPVESARPIYNARTDSSDRQDCGAPSAIDLLDRALRPQPAQFVSARDCVQRCQFQVVDGHPQPEAI